MGEKGDGEGLLTEKRRASRRRERRAQWSWPSCPWSLWERRWSVGAGVGLNLPQPGWPEVQEPAQSQTTGVYSSECGGDTPDPHFGGASTAVGHGGPQWIWAQRMSSWTLCSFAMAGRESSHHEDSNSAWRLRGIEVTHPGVRVPPRPTPAR